MSEHPPDWYPDPAGRNEHRYWDGQTWTDQVANHGRQSTDPMTASAPLPTTGMSEAKIQGQAAKAGATGGPTAGGLLDQLVLVVNQKVKLIEVNTEYAVYDPDGTQIGAIRQVGQSKLKKAARFLGNYDQFFTHSLQLVDTGGNVLLTVTRPAKFAKSKVHITDGAGNEIGSIIQQNMIGKIRFSLEAGGQTIGSLNGENWRAWNFNLQDANGREVARITKTFEGLAKTLFTTADNYVLQVHEPLADPIRSLVIASAVSVDLALKQDSRGFS
ncbi:MAG: phospholipid scramblase-related protein [Actinomycetota bacterium]